jgi:glycosyltransferase involved in cell wall biosynthesis
MKNTTPFGKHGANYLPERDNGQSNAGFAAQTPPVESHSRWAHLRSWYQQKLHYQYLITDLVAVQQNTPLSGSPSQPSAQCLSPGDDIYYKLAPCLTPGWYMAEVRMDVPDGMVNACFYLDMEQPGNETLDFGLPMRSGQMAKRLLYVPTPARLRFDPSAKQGAFELQHFRIVRMPKAMAIRRLHKKLEAAQHMQTMWTPAANNIKNFDDCWNKYNAIFASLSAQDVANHQICSSELGPSQSPAGKQPSANRRKHWADMRSWLAQKIRYQFFASDLVTIQQLTPLETSKDRLSSQPSYRCEGDDAYFRLKQPLMPGWYMAEVRMQVPDGVVDARFYLDIGEGESEAMSYGMPMRTGRMAKRLLYVPEPARLRFDPMTHEGTFTLQHFRLVRMLKGMALNRMHKKLRHAAMHMQIPSAKIALDAQNFDQCWREYNALFESIRTGNAISYQRWIQEVEPRHMATQEQQDATMQSWAYKPIISILLPTYNTPTVFLRQCINSILTQSYPRWQLCIADDASTQPHVRALIQQYAAQDQRICYTLRDHNGHISECSNTALKLASGEFIALLDHDDCLPAHALYEVVNTLQERSEAQIIYSDEDKLDQQGQRCDPFFKPDWSPDLLSSQNYMTHLLVYRRQLLLDAGGFRTGYEGSQDYDLLLRCIARLPEATQATVVHIPKVLYHWRMMEQSTAMGHERKDYATPAARHALQDFMDQRHPGVRMEVVQPGIYRARWPLPAKLPLVSLLIPTRDGLDHLKTCIESILQKTTYPNYEILVIDNQSTCPDTLAYMRQLETNAKYQKRIRILPYDHPFNFSAINNYAAKQAHGEILGLINNDVEIINGDWLSEMVSHVVRADIGCVGAKLYYPDGTLQHAGVVLGIGGVAGHSHKYFPGASNGYFGRLRTTHNVSAVTGAARLVRKSIFEQIGGLDEQGLSVAFNDVDFCIKVREAGYRNLLTPFANLYHHESKSRGPENTRIKEIRFQSEIECMKKRWQNTLLKDPFYNQNLTQLREDYSLDL